MLGVKCFEVARLRLSQPVASARDCAFAFEAVFGKIPRSRVGL